jgi:hypothetical protein
MKDKIPIIFLSILLYCSVVSFQQNNDKYIFFLHNKFLEEHRLEDEHPEYGSSILQTPPLYKLPKATIHYKNAIIGRDISIILYYYLINGLICQV